MQVVVPLWILHKTASAKQCQRTNRKKHYPTDLSKSAQQTMIKFLTNVNSSPVIDKYAELRSHRIHVYSKEEIDAAQPIRRDYLNFMNDQSLYLLRQGHKKSAVEPLAKKLWNATGRYETYIKFGKYLSSRYKANNFDEKYRKQYEEKLNEVMTLEKERDELYAQLISRIKSDTITKPDKKSLQMHIKCLEVSLHKQRLLLDKISTNWSRKLNSVDRNGPEKQKTGPKPKDKNAKKAIDEVQFKTAMELKASKKPLGTNKSPIISDSTDACSTCDIVDMNGNTVASGVVLKSTGEMLSDVTFIKGKTTVIDFEFDPFPLTLKKILKLMM